MTLTRTGRIWLTPLILALILALAALLLHNVDAAAFVSHATVRQLGAALAQHAALPSVYLPITAHAATPRTASAVPPSKFGIDPLHPIDIAQGTLSPISASPEIVAATGADWVRLNFVLGPWSSVNEPTLIHGRTWQETYGAIVEGYRAAGLYIYALISYEAMPTDPRESLRAAPPPGATTHPWIDHYVTTVMQILHLYSSEIDAFETLNEPDDWHGGYSAWIHPGWFAILQQQVYQAVNQDPSLAHVKVVSGPLQGFSNNHNAAAGYLQRVYWEGITRFGWGQEGMPFPFDGIGYHLYLNDRYFLDPDVQQRAIAARYTYFTGQMQAVIERAEGRTRPLYLSEIGFASHAEDEQLQADNLRAVLAQAADDPNVALAVWFALQDFPLPNRLQTFGLYRLGLLSPENQKPAFAAFQSVTMQRLTAQHATAQ